MAKTNYIIFKQFITNQPGDPEWAVRRVYVAKLFPTDNVIKFQTKNLAEDKLNSLKIQFKDINRKFKIIER